MKYKVGDRVIMNHTNRPEFHGRRATVLRVNRYPMYCVLVEELPSTMPDKTWDTGESGLDPDSAVFSPLEQQITAYCNRELGRA